MKKTIVALALIITAAFSVQAQQPGDVGKQQHHRHFRKHEGGDRLAKKLNFTDAQKQQLKDMNSAYQKKLADLKKHDEISVKEFKSQMHALRQEHRQQFTALLTPVQKDQLANWKQERKDKAKERATARAEKMKTKLGLTDAQANQLKEMRTGTMAKIKSIKEDKGLSADQKHEQIKGLVIQQKDQLKTILNPEQLQQLEQMKGQHRGRNFSK